MALYNRPLGARDLVVNGRKGVTVALLLRDAGSRYPSFKGHPIKKVTGLGSKCNFTGVIFLARISPTQVRYHRR